MTDELENRYFRKEEALKKVGKIIESLVDFSGVKKGTSGTVIKADQSGGEDWTVAIQWHLETEKLSVSRGKIGVEPFLFVKTGKPLVDWFSKYEYERYLKEVGE